MKVCNKCGVNKPDTSFSKRTYKSGRVALQNKCKDCERVIKKLYYKTHEVARRRHGFSEETYNALLEESKGLCTICSSPMGDKVCFDHDHETGKFRAVLCNKCNTALGLVNDDLTILERMVGYLKGHGQE
jgi:hypothetical protein